MRDIKRRRSSIQSTGQITRAMKLVATVKLQKARERQSIPDLIRWGLSDHAVHPGAFCRISHSVDLQGGDNPRKAVIGDDIQPRTCGRL